jgi:HSP20 family protein
MADIEHFFDRAMHGFWPRRRAFFGFPAHLRETAWLPDMDVFDKDGKTVVRLDLPGLKREDIDVTVEGDMLVIHGHREEATEIEEKDYYCAERASGEFSRAITLPEGATAESVEATYTDGILEVVVPKPAATEKPVATKVEVR